MLLNRHPGGDRREMASDRGGAGGERGLPLDGPGQADVGGGGRGGNSVVDSDGGHYLAAFLALFN